MDGVMIDSERQSNEGWLWAAEQLGVEMPMWLIDSFKGAPNTLSCQFFDNYYHGKIDYWEARKLRTEHIYKIREKEGLPIKKGLFELLDYIRENGIKCAVATSTRRESAEKDPAYDWCMGISGQCGLWGQRGTRQTRTGYFSGGGR